MINDFVCSLDLSKNAGPFEAILITERRKWLHVDDSLDIFQLGDRHASSH